MLTEDEEESLCRQKTPAWRRKNPKLEGGQYCRKHIKKRKKKAGRGTIRRKTEDEETLRNDDDEDLAEGEAMKRGRKNADSDQEIGEGQKALDDSTEGGASTSHGTPLRAMNSNSLTTPALKIPPEVVKEKINRRGRKYVEEISMNCHRCQRSGNGRVTRCTKCRVKRFSVPCCTRCCCCCCVKFSWRFFRSLC